MEFEKEELRTALLAGTVIAFWLLTPIYLQVEHGYSAIKVSFGITVIYYLGFKLWKRWNQE